MARRGSCPRPLASLAPEADNPDAVTLDMRIVTRRPDEAGEMSGTRGQWRPREAGTGQTEAVRARQQRRGRGAESTGAGTRSFL